MSSGMTTGSSSRRMITAFFDSRTDAEEAVSRLHAAGISRDGIRLTPSSEEDAGTAATQSFPEASAGLWDSLRDLFLPDEDRHTYAEGLRRGGFLVSVSASDADYERVIDILDDEGTIDIDERAESWRSEGWSASSAAGSLSGGTTDTTSRTTGMTAGSGSALGTASMNASSERVSTGDEVIPVAEEHLSVGKRDVSHGRVRIRSYVVETPVSEQVNLREERVEVERRPVSGTMQAGSLSGDPFQERTIEVEERGEEAVVSKEARVTEELVIRKDVEQRTETVSDTVRKTEVEVEDERGSQVSGTGTKDRNP
jgi:uncharacterized protein (TIGR02271 family)